jgi:adenine-specific DNA-methyltransferase
MFLKYGTWLAEPRESAPFFSDKIILRQTADSIIAHLDLTLSINLNNVYNIGQIDSNYNIKYILGILNSRVIKYLYQNISQEKGRVFAEVKKVYLEKIPIYQATDAEQAEITDLVEKILECKKNPLSDTALLELEIDRLVYQLYGLTNEEIKIIEGDNL